MLAFEEKTNSTKRSPGNLHANSKVVVAVALKQRLVLGRVLQLHALCTLCPFFFIWCILTCNTFQIVNVTLLLNTLQLYTPTDMCMVLVCNNMLILSNDIM